MTVEKLTLRVISTISEDLSTPTLKMSSPNLPISIGSGLNYPSSHFPVDLPLKNHTDRIKES